MTDDVFLYFGSVVVVFAVAAWAGWAVAGRRAPKPQVLPDHVWLCESCTSFNDPTHLTCYRCHRPRAVDAREVEPDPDFKIDQQLGRSKSSLDWGASSPWLAADEPLRDAWLAERARSIEAPAGSEPTVATPSGEPPDDSPEAPIGPR